jgi:hypothetical protein
MLVWTIVLGFICCVEVYKTLRMPEFNATLLSLVGIRAGPILASESLRVQVNQPEGEFVLRHQSAREQFIKVQALLQQINYGRARL